MGGVDGGGRGGKRAPGLWEHQGNRYNFDAQLPNTVELQWLEH